MEKLSENFNRVLKLFGFTYLASGPDGDSYKNSKKGLVTIKNHQEWICYNDGVRIDSGTSSPDLEQTLNFRISRNEI